MSLEIHSASHLVHQFSQAVYYSDWNTTEECIAKGGEAVLRKVLEINIFKGGAARLGLTTGTKYSQGRGPSTRTKYLNIL